MRYFDTSSQTPPDETATGRPGTKGKGPDPKVLVLFVLPGRSIRIFLSCSFADGTTATAISESADQNPRRRQFARHSLTNRRGGRRTRHSPTRRCFEVSPVI